MAESLGDLAGDAPRLFGAIVSDAGGHAADGKDTVLVHVLDRIVELHLAVPAAHDYDRDLALELSRGAR